MPPTPSTSGNGCRNPTTTTPISTTTTIPTSSACSSPSACSRFTGISQEGFAERYETLLSRTAMATAYDLAREFGIDVRDRAFWDGSVAVIRGDVAQFEQVAAQSIR